MMVNVLSIAGSDPSGGAGVQADLKTFSALGAYGMAAITALTAQNTQGVRAIHLPPADFLRAQLDAIFEDVRVDALKIGMVGDVTNMSAIARVLDRYNPAHVVLDPVMLSTSGAVLLERTAIETLKAEILPRASIVTPNLPEACLLSGMNERADPRALAEKILAMGARAILLKGGHGTGESSDDLLMSAQIQEWLRGSRVPTHNTHGTGCTLSAALSVFLARGDSLKQAASHAKAFVFEALRHADDLSVGHGHGPINHLRGVGGS